MVVCANDAVPHWIWVANQGREISAVFTKSFAIDREVERAILFTAADFCELRIDLNGAELTTVEAFGDPLQWDITRQLNSGTNHLKAHASPCPGPSAIAIRLQVRFSDGSELIILTNESWSVESSGRALAIDLGQVAEAPWLILPDAIRINPFDDYTQWKRALNHSEGTDPATFQVLPGFTIERLRSAQPDEGSWVSLGIDSKGRIVIGKEDKGILRMTLSSRHDKIEQVELIDTGLQECRGLLFAHDSLYANANNSKGFYRLQDTNHDDQYNEVRLLHHFPGGVGHGRNDLALGPDGMIYSIHGDSVDVPTDFTDKTSPFRENRRGVQMHEGHVIRTDRDGKTWELLTAGLRNPFGIDFNSDGEMFTYDADDEFDMGAPWYRPTRVQHLVSGGDFGWRGLTGDWPPYFPDHADNAPPTLDIGKGSPTSIKFGYQSNFPYPYRHALFILDWAYGRVLIVHMAPRGASYFCRAETFLRGRPLNVTDLDFGLDGAMYFVTGGRKTQSALYRVGHVGPKIASVTQTPQQQARVKHSELSRAQRHELEASHRRVGIAAVKKSWPHLANADPSIRYAARIAVEHQPIELWNERALSEQRPLAALTSMLALARSHSDPDRARIIARINALPLGKLPTMNQEIAAYTYQLCLHETDSMDAALLRSTAERLDLLYPSTSPGLHRILRELLVKLDVPSVVPQTLRELEDTTDQVNHFHALFVLRNARLGWNFDHRQTYFQALNNTDNYLSSQGMSGFLDNIRRDAMAHLTEKERMLLKRVLEKPSSEPSVVELPPRPFVQEWKLHDLTDSLGAIDSSRNFERGQRMYSAALCARCHRLGSIGKSVGPDLTSVAQRFSRRDILLSILEPSRVIAVNYRSHRIVTNDGRLYEGRVVHQGDYRAPVLKIASDPLAPGRLSEIVKSKIESTSLSPLSFMPSGLLNTLTEQEILDLLAFIETAGNENRPNFR